MTVPADPILALTLTPDLPGAESRVTDELVLWQRGGDSDPWHDPALPTDCPDVFEDEPESTPLERLIDFTFGTDDEIRAEVEAMTPEEVRAQLEAEGIDLTEKKAEMWRRFVEIREKEAKEREANRADL